MRWWMLLSLATAYANPYAQAPSAAMAADVATDPFSWRVDPVSVAAGGAGSVTLRLGVPSGFHIYRDTISVDVTDAAGLSVGAVDLPPGLVRPNPVNGADRRELYDSDVVVRLPLAAPSTASGIVDVRLVVHHQGCSGSVCYPPVAEPLGVVVHVRASAPPDPARSGN